MGAAENIALASMIVSAGSLGIAGWALVYSRRQAGAADRSADAAEKSADEAKRSADAAEDANHAAVRANHLAEEANALANRANELNTPSAYGWEIVHVRNALFRLRNCGTERADDVIIHLDDAKLVARKLPRGQSIVPGGGHDFILKAGYGTPMPTHLMVSWEAQTEPVAVPMPAVV
ncbi:hypothetical protein [Nocardia africana]